jgi:DNA-directed RNA polymerase specialized sigma24 family protein
MLPELFEEYYREWGRWVRNQARHLARGDLDLVDDLAQEAFWRLLELDVKRIKKNSRAYIQSVLWDHMLMVLRRERRAKAIGSSKSKRARCRSPQGSRRHRMTRRTRRRLSKGPYHYNAIPIEEEANSELWDAL